MQQIKIFKGIENDLSALEAEVNAWIAKPDVEVINIFGNIAPQSGAASSPGGPARMEYPPSDVLLVVHYRKM